jgi:hypothetical protein
MSKYIIKDIRYHMPNGTIHASLYNEETNQLLITATLDYIEKRLSVMMLSELAVKNNVSIFVAKQKRNNQ